MNAGAGVNTDRKKAGPKTRRRKPASFPIASRLIKPVEFKNVFEKPRVSSDDCFKVLARNNEKQFSRLGMAVSRQVDRTAVGRNRIKRVVRESFRNHFGPRECRTQGGNVDRSGNPADFMVLPRRKAAKLSNRRLYRSLEAHWAKLERLMEHDRDPSASLKMDDRPQEASNKGPE